MYIFRNSTIENIFDGGHRFSGYGDISEIPDTDCYLWFYIVLPNPDAKKQVAEIEGIGRSLEYVLTHTESDKPFYLFSLEQFYDLRLCDTDSNVISAISSVNNYARRFASEHNNVKFIDFGEFLSRYPQKDRINWRFWFMARMALNPALVCPFKEWWHRTLGRLQGKRYKCMVLDLDNTLWNGVLGEDGIEGVSMSGDYPGNAFELFQTGLKALAAQGVILAICSKNNEADVNELWAKNPFMQLERSLFPAVRINWNNKADNIIEIASELNIGLDSMVFVDDNPTERELVRQRLPEVAVPDFPEHPHGLPDFYKMLVDKYFRAYSLTEEDSRKAEQYRSNAARTRHREKFGNLEDFIRSLDIHIDILKADEFNIPRIAQMTQKTNQFNLTTRRYTETDITRLLNEGAAVFCIKVSDRFGDNGITGAIILKITGNIAEIDSLLLSCRILGKDIETTFALAILDALHRQGFVSVKATFIPTAKNGQTSSFYESLGFSKISVSDNGTKTYRMDLPCKTKNRHLHTVIFR